jgi:hypothetical protein
MGGEGMTYKQLFLVVGLVGVLSGAAFLARETEKAAAHMAGSATKLLVSLDENQKKQATFDFDDKERTRWFFTPQQSKGKATRKGLRLADMNDKQKELTKELIAASTSQYGSRKATIIMSLEAILADLEKGRGPVRDPGWYFVSFFGTPSKTGKWGWRIEGHHLSLNFTLDGGKVVSATPCFYGANPAVIKSGKGKGMETLPEAEQDFRTLIGLLDDDQRKVAQQTKQFKEIEEGRPKHRLGDPIGLAGAKMNDKQKTALEKLIKGYAGRMHSEVAAVELAEVKKAGLDKVHFAYAGDGTPGKPHSYRVHGPTFLIEFINEQRDSAGNPANHIHSSWRNIKGDFGLTGS